MLHSDILLLSRKAQYELNNKLPGQALHCCCWQDRQALLTKMSQFTSGTFHETQLKHNNILHYKHQKTLFFFEKSFRNHVFNLFGRTGKADCVPNDQPISYYIPVFTFSRFFPEIFGGRRGTPGKTEVA